MRFVPDYFFCILSAFVRSICPEENDSLFRAKSRFIQRIYSSLPAVDGVLEPPPMRLKTQPVEQSLPFGRTPSVTSDSTPSALLSWTTGNGRRLCGYHLRGHDGLQEEVNWFPSYSINKRCWSLAKLHLCSRAGCRAFFHNSRIVPTDASPYPPKEVSGSRPRYPYVVVLHTLQSGCHLPSTFGSTALNLIRK